MLLKDYVQGEQEQASFETLKASVSDTSPSLPVEAEPQTSPTGEQQRAYTAYYALYEQNADLPHG